MKILCKNESVCLTKTFFSSCVYVLEPYYIIKIKIGSFKKFKNNLFLFIAKFP